MPSELKAQSLTTVNITPSTTQISSAQIGNNVEVQLTVENVQNLFAWSLNLTWNPQVLNLTNVQEGDFLSNAGSTIFLWSPSISPISRSQGHLSGVACSLLEASSANGSGVLATITFQILKAEVSIISIEGTELVSPSSLGSVQFITATLKNGTVTITNSNSNSNNRTDISSDDNQNNSTDHSSSNPTAQTQTPYPTTQTSHPATHNFILIILVVLLILSVGVLLLLKKTSATKLTKK